MGASLQKPTTPDPDKPSQGLPKPLPQSLSLWLEQTQCDSLWDHGRTDPLPVQADCVIIGSGMTGCLAAKHFKDTWPDKDVVILEARAFCSGATGRNAGHCKPDQWRGFTKYQNQFGTEQALKILQNERRTLDALLAYVQENQVDCDLWSGDTLDVAMTADIAASARDNFAKFKAAGGCVEQIKVIDDKVEAAKVSRLKHAKACYAWPAATLQPRKLTAHIMRSNLLKGVALHTFTVARSISANDDGSMKWKIHTDRGDIVCESVIHATNAYIAANEPLFKNVVQALAHVCTKVTPPPSFVGSGVLPNSYGVLLPDSCLISINPRSTSDGIILFGGENKAQKDLNSRLAPNGTSCFDDGVHNTKLATAEARTFAEEEFQDWKSSPDNDAESEMLGLSDRSWSGIIGMSGDGVPFVGEIPGKPGQWACVAHNGHGMARIFTAAPALVQLMQGKTWASTGLPEVFELTPERISRLQQGRSRLFGQHP